MRGSVIGLAVALAAIGSDAQAQLFKCKGPDGKIVYSDTACEATATKGALPAGVSNRAYENEAKAAADKAAADKAAAEQKAQAEALIEAAKKAGLVAPARAPSGSAPAAAEKPQPRELTNAERERLRSLEIDANRSGMSPEQKRATALEMESIRTGRESRLSGEDRARREGLHADLTSADAARRKKALHDLQSIYYP